MTYNSPDHQSSDWQRYLDPLKTLDIQDFPSFPDVASRISERLDTDLAALQEGAGFIFSRNGDPEDLAEHSIDLLRHWYISKNPPSLTALCVFTVESMGLDLAPDMRQTLVLSGALGEIENDLSYHNNMHYRKVLLQTICLIIVHNNIYKDTSRAFDAQQIALLLIAACIHDLGHDGLGNTVKGVFEQSRLERQSFELALPHLKAAGLQDEDQLGAIKVLLLCTDVTPLGDPANPVGQMKSAYRFHYLGDNKKIESLNLDADLQILEKDPDLTMMGLILHEADIGTSAGLSYEVTKFETSLLRGEVSDDPATPQHVVDFLNRVCERQMLSNAAQDLYGANMARIYALAEEDIKNGNQPFPEPEHSGFLLGQHEGDSDPQIIN